MTIKHSAPTGRRVFVLAAAAASIATAAAPSFASDFPSQRWAGWLFKTPADVSHQAATPDVKAELSALKAITATRTAEDTARDRWWSFGGPAHRWNELLLQEMQDTFVVLPMAARHLALLHVAIDDAVTVAKRGAVRAPEATRVAMRAAQGAKPVVMKRLFAPSEAAAASTAAADVLGYIFPARAAFFAAKAEEAIEAHLRGGGAVPHAIAAGRAIGRSVATRVIAHGKSDRSDSKWSGTVPEGPGTWKGTPASPAAATWTPLVLASPSEFRPAPPPAFDSETTKAALAEIKNFTRTPKSNHRAVYWEVHGGARAHTLWNDIARLKLLEQGASGEAAAHAMAVLNVAMADAGIACWDAKFTYWYIRPPQFDTGVKSLFAPPSHPSYPAAHGCYSTAAATVLRHLFPRDAGALSALGKEAAEARIWAGIHYRFDIEAGQELGRKVAMKVLNRASVVRTN